MMLLLLLLLRLALYLKLFTIFFRYTAVEFVEQMYELLEHDDVRYRFDLIEFHFCESVAAIQFELSAPPQSQLSLLCTVAVVDPISQHET